MSITPYAAVAARTVRVTTLVAVLVLMVAFVALQTFSAHYGQPASAVVDSTSIGGAGADAVAQR